MTSSAAERYSKRYRHWDVEELGWKYNLDNIRASLLLPQVGKMDSHCARRREIAARYDEAFAAVDGIDVMTVPKPAWSARHLYTICVDAARRDEMLVDLQEQGIGVAVNYRAVHLLHYFRRRFGFRRGDLPAAESIGDRTISLPLYHTLTDEQVERVIQAATVTALDDERRRAVMPAR